jgi:hypothetical protein
MMVRPCLSLTIAVLLVGILRPVSLPAGPESRTSVYVGSKACQPCHEEEYASFQRYAKKSNSYRSIERLEKGLSHEDLRKWYS